MDFINKNERKKASKYIGNNYQIGGTRHYLLTDVNSNNCRCIDVRTGSGFEYTVVCDRGLDISLASYKGTNLVHLTENLETNPAFYDCWETEWLRTFSGGLLTTCGPINLGSPCEDNDEKLGQHGRWSALPARQVCDFTDFESGKIEIAGTLYDSVTFGHKLKIYRKIKSEFGKSAVIIEDTIKNEGGRPIPLNVLYHINFGYPFLCETTTVHIPSVECLGYDDYSQEKLYERNTINSPDGNNLEKNYLHTFSKKDDTVTAWVHNENIADGLAVYINFNPISLPYFTQWTLEDVKDYVLALEPANVPCESRDVLREKNILPYISPDDTVNFRVEIGVIEGNDNIKNKLVK